jgi:SAM-dependent methyltransferase
MNSQASVVSDFWSVNRHGVSAALSWLEHPVLKRRTHERVSGHPDIGTAEWFKLNFLDGPVENALSLGCGFGEFDRTAILLPIAKHIDAVDIAEGAVEHARRVNADLPISYSVRDLNEAVFSEGKYDAVLAVSSVHHVFQLEHLFRQCRRCLKPGGLFFLDEYIGPSRFQTSPYVIELINRILRTLPARLRYNLKNNDGSLIEKFSPQPVEHFETHDPSEAVRSGEIMSTLRQYFEVLAVKPYGGTILHMLLDGIAGNFDENSESDVCLLQSFSLLEETLEERGVIESDFAAIACRVRN